MIKSRDLIKLKSNYTLSIRGNIEDEFRRGDLIELPPKGDLVILGDLHGNRENFNKITNAIELGKHADRHIIVQEATHTYEVKEDKSFLLHEDIVNLKSKFPNQVHIILGNHELSELTGKEILKGGICYNILFKEAMKKHYGSHYSTVEELFHNYISTMPIACKTQNGIFISHSTPEEKYIKYYSLNLFRKGISPNSKEKILIEKLVWGRDLRQEAADAFAARVKSEILIVGHTACKRGYQVPNNRHIVIDSKGRFATYIHFQLNKEYKQSYLVKNCIHYINKKVVEELLKQRNVAKIEK